MKILFPATLVAAALALTACGGGGGGNDAPASNSGTVNVAITDNPSCGFNHVWVTVQQIRVNGSATAGDNDAGWQTLTLATPQRIDLLSLTNGVLQQLGQFPLSAGQYQQIRLVLVANANTVVPTTASGADGTEVALSTPSATQSGYKVIGNFTVQPNTLTDLVLDFDACRSIVQKGNGSYSLKPVVTATPVVVSGRIKGYVSPNEVGATVYAEQNGHVIKGTVVNTDGSFTLAPLVQSSVNGNYDVVVVDKGYADAIIRAVPVTANADTTVSTAAAPISTPASGIQIASGSATSASDGILVRVLQTVNGGTYEIASMVTNGSFSFTLPAGMPTYVGTYSSSLPIALTSDGNAAGQYQIEADETVTGAVQTTPINITSSSITNLNFKF
ncbi:DUF4382 domain-containing protein [Aquirhabdus sp.]|uniref:DUF4382 domain-containing protein n=1 Tax=Aquirhabdus sp. TaxID=2824160 RepID=UPI00396C4ED9